MNLDSKKFFNFSRFGDNIALLDDNGALVRYADLAALSSKLDSIMQRDVCVLFCSNALGCGAFYAGLIESRIALLNIASDLDSKLALNLINDYKARYLCMPNALVQDYIKLGFKVILEQYNYTLLESNLDSKDCINKDLALLLSTSGSTGSVKFVRLSYQNLFSNTQSIIEYLSLDSKERAFLILPLNYTFGLSVINTHLCVGASVAITDKSVMQKGFWEFIESSKASSISGVPYTFEMLFKLKFFDKKLVHLRTLLQAGGKLSIALQEEFARFTLKENKKFIIMYGQTEATARMSYLPPKFALSKLGSIGIAIPHGKFELLDSKDELIKDCNIKGELVYKGENVALGYAVDRSSLSKGDEFKGILKTGDIAYVDADGFYYIVGRKSRFIKMQGRRIGLDEIECLLHTHFKDISQVVAGIDDMLYIFIESKKDSNINDIKKFICTALKIAPLNVKIKEIDKIPRTQSGKILYSNLEKYYD